MRIKLILAIGAVAAVTASVAVAAVYTASGVSETTATFAASQTDDVKSRSCTGRDSKAFTLTHGRYTGTADFAIPGTELDGPLTIKARTVYSTTDGLGYVHGSFRVKDDDTRLVGKFTGTLKGNQLVGFLTATSRGHRARVLGNLSATFAPATGFSDGRIGVGSSGAVLAVLAGPICKHPKRDDAAKSDDKQKREGESKDEDKSDKQKRSRLVRVAGKVTAVGDGNVGSSITVAARGPATATCVRDDTSPSTSGFAVETKVLMRCELDGSTWKLRELKKAR